jgi:hypothetical protein
MIFVYKFLLSCSLLINGIGWPWIRQNTFRLEICSEICKKKEMKFQVAIIWHGPKYFCIVSSI